MKRSNKKEQPVSRGSMFLERALQKYQQCRWQRQGNTNAPKYKRKKKIKKRSKNVLFSKFLV